MKRLTFILSLLIGATALPAHTGEADELAWMSGHWCGGSADEKIEEYWMPPHGGVLLGLARTTKGERTAEFEFLRIVRVDGLPTFIAQPNGVPPTSFKRTDGGADWIRFENPDHDFPKRVEYRRQGTGLHAEASGPGRDGKTFTIRYDYTPCAAPKR
jgi:hypothetical protein